MRFYNSHDPENSHRFLEHINSLHPSIKFALEMQKGDKTVHTQTGICNINHFKCVCKTLDNRAKKICEVANIEGELEHLGPDYMEVF